MNAATLYRLAWVGVRVAPLLRGLKCVEVGVSVINHGESFRHSYESDVAEWVVSFRLHRLPRSGVLLAIGGA